MCDFVQYFHETSGEIKPNMELCKVEFLTAHFTWNLMKKAFKGKKFFFLIFEHANICVHILV